MNEDMDLLSSIRQNLKEVVGYAEWLHDKIKECEGDKDLLAYEDEVGHQDASEKITELRSALTGLSYRAYKLLAKANRKHNRLRKLI